MHYSFVTTGPTPGWDSRGNGRGFDQSFATTVWGKYPGFAKYIGKKGREMRREQAAFAGPNVKVPAIT